jgi:hypothetical protein
MDQLLAIVSTYNQLLSMITFALLILLAALMYVRSNAIYILWDNAVQAGKLHKLTITDMLQPWLVRIYQRYYMHNVFAVILTCISLTVLTQILARPIEGASYEVFILLRSVAILMTILSLLRGVFSIHLGLRAEMKSLERKYSDYTIKLEDLIALHEADKYFSIDKLPKKR